MQSGVSQWFNTWARNEAVCAGTVYRHFFGRLEIIPPLVSNRLPYLYAFRQLIVRKIIKIVASRCLS